MPEACINLCCFHFEKLLFDPINRLIAHVSHKESESKLFNNTALCGSADRKFKGISGQF